MKPIFEYDDYRAYLRDYYEVSKRTRRAFNYRSFAAKAGLASPMHLRLVMTGERNLTQKTLPKFAQGLGLGEKETEFFESLVYFTQAKSSDEKLRYHERISRLRSCRRVAKISGEQQRSLFAKWHYPVLYELVQSPTFKEDGAWISKALGKSISTAQATSALKELEEAALLSRDGAGRLRPNHIQVRTDDEVENLFVRAYHRTMALKAIERIDDPLDEREFGFVTVCTTTARFAKMKAMIKDFVREANRILSCDAQESGERIVAQLNAHFFKLIK